MGLGVGSTGCSSDSQANGTGGASTGGSPPSGGSPGSGGASSGGSSSGGSSARGGSTGSGGSGSGGTGSGGAGSGGTGSGGASGTGGTPGTGGAGGGGAGGAGSGSGGTGGVSATGGATGTGGAHTGGTTGPASGGEPGTVGLKPRVVALTDISTWETDDHESMTRFLVHADLYEIEGLVATTGYSYDVADATVQIGLIKGVINAYEKDLPKLLKRSNQSGHLADESKQAIGYWPSPKYLRDRSMLGSKNRGQKFIGDSNDSPGSDLIIKLADESDERPVWVTVWGGGNTVAQSIYRVKKDRTAEQFKAFLRKLRVYAITDQDRTYTGAEPLSYSSHGWMRSEAGSDLLFIWDECAWKAHNGTGVSNWSQYETHIQGHGALGSQYPKYKYGVEGDTPALLFVTPNGLNNPDVPSQTSWGGTFKGDANNLWQGAGTCNSYFGRFYPAAFNNFAARMDWAKDGVGNRNPAVVVDGDTSVTVLVKSPKAGTSVTLDASKSTDPDGSGLKFNWWVQTDAGTYSGKVNIANASANTATVEIPSDAAGKSFHVICEVTDDGQPNLSAYRRIIFTPN
ncbi:MAG: DUF1593 domain-containing protein [Deltaproteobacteria bacterium]|nr:DUF1593 domain-containing protein [Deltaproteobacteria bacterium]